MTLQIITDTGCDLPPHIIEQYEIDVLPLMVDLYDQQYEDGKTLHPKKLYEAMREGAVAKTSQVPPLLLKETFEKYAKQKKDCLYIAFSSNLSGTYQTAQLMKNEVLEDYPEFTCEIVDSKCASLGQGLAVYLTANEQKNGKSDNEVIEAAHFYTSHMEHLFTVDDLEYLLRGGRVSRTSAFVGSLLKIKPLLHVEDGSLVPLEKIRGRKKVLKRMADVMVERGVQLENQTIAISHGDDVEGVEELKSYIEQHFPIKECIVYYVGCAIGAHSGPGTIALFFLNKTK